MSNSTNRLSPRQKMINIMYIVFLAMVALNVSSDVLSGFKHVEDAMDASNEGTQKRNAKLFDEFTALHDKNAEKTGVWYNKAKEARRESARMFAQLDSLKLEIVRKADGKKADVHKIKNRDNVEAVYQVMGNQDIVDKAMFENVPVSAAVTLLAKLQGDVLNKETEELTTLMQNVDRGDVRVNQLSAFVIPNSRNVMRGSQFEAQIVMAALDSTQTPAIYIGDKLYDAEKKGYYSVVTSREGIQTLKGYLEVDKPDGSTEQLPFETDYFVSEPMATVSNTMMNVMYAGIDNPISISVPGIASSQISASMSNGVLSRSGAGWVAKPKDVGKDAVISVTASQNGRSMNVSQMAFHVRRLPDPTPYIIYKDASGNSQRYKGGIPISKSALLAAGGIGAAIDDGLLNVEFKVKSFRIDIFDSMGNDIPEDSQSAQFSERQLTKLRALQKGKTFFITRVKAVGPDGIERTLSPIQVILN